MASFADIVQAIQQTAASAAQHVPALGGRSASYSPQQTQNVYAPQPFEQAQQMADQYGQLPKASDGEGEHVLTGIGNRILGVINGEGDENRSPEVQGVLDDAAPQDVGSPTDIQGYSTEQPASLGEGWGKDLFANMGGRVNDEAAAIGSGQTGQGDGTGQGGEAGPDGAGTDEGGYPVRDYYLSGRRVADDDLAGIRASQIITVDHPDWGFGDNWGEFQRNGTREQWLEVVLDPRNQAYFEDVYAPYGGYDAFAASPDSQYAWWNATQLRNPSNLASMSEADWRAIYGDSAAAMASTNQALANAGWQFSLDPNSVPQSQDDELYQWLMANANDSFNVPDGDRSLFFMNFGNSGLSTEDYLNRAGIERGILSGINYSEDELNDILGGMGGARFTTDQSRGSDEFKDLPENYNPYITTVQGYRDYIENPEDLTGSVLHAVNPDYRWYME